MEEIWDSNGPYALAKLADRMVSVPRDNEAQISLYALCRAWVRNNPSLPLLAETPPQQQPELKDAAARPGDAAGTIATDEGLQAGVQPPQAPPPPHLENDQQQAQQQQQQTLPLDAQPNGLLSILPPVLPPTLLETETAPPNYPLDDFDAQEPEEALRKFKQHWTAVRQYHQALRAAKLSRHRERLVALLGEPSLLQPQVLQMQMQASGLVINPQQFLQQQQLQQMHQVGMLGLPTQVLLDQMPNGGLTNLSAFHGAGLVVGPGPGGGLPTGLQGGPMPGMVNFGVGPSATGFVAGGAGVSNVVDAQAALATIMNLGAADTGAVAQHQPAQLLQLQQQQQLGLVGGGLAADPQLGLQPYDVAVALPHQQHNPQQSGVPQPSAAGITTGQQPVLGQLSAAVAAAAEAGNGQGKCQEHQLTAADTMTANAGNAVLPNIAAGQEAATGSAGEQHALVVRSEGLKGMDIDSGSLHSS
ncbi:hypothetical protein Vretimale_16675 [Volvox reticuliferus]|uniref:Uncharacterized protein n=1 Tax=Volvox reticuliferus TaxID=1737510 RepID=A0A8J4LXN3_9CHLO|nr:hypothetical protein Vretifemale_8524 [Volvox reticuliferus]GIM13609.1 hypothetical protein Vretimale_16675 [Volvox reticuliferus]